MSDRGASGGGPAPGLDFLIFYTAVDQKWAEWVAWQLEDAGYRVLIQAWDFVPGSNWPARMQQGIADAQRTIALLSNAYLRSAYGQAEWQAAQAADPRGFARKLLPIRLEGCRRHGRDDAHTHTTGQADPDPADPARHPHPQPVAAAPARARIGVAATALEPRRGDQPRPRHRWPRRLRRPQILATLAVLTAAAITAAALIAAEPGHPSAGAALKHTTTPSPSLGPISPRPLGQPLTNHTSAV
ncbi:toll/interleukin-1 receptor domain-containing protein [Frankia sp. Cas3]|uniref:toll/interleukin-1 receptor domain-containing protein n=1 Tax=Frankia sp. Cas3 TaxID=3073926 RepID=UPI002AD24070|nr:toll/interleukin-1 receptor domain-containing protein [Frankia sp. Cas3]